MGKDTPAAQVVLDAESAAAVFTVESQEPVIVSGGGQLAERDLMSPFVWRLLNGRHAMMLRGVPRNGCYDTDTGMIWYGESDDGLSFTMRDEPVLAPGPGFDDGAGCEDPTVVIDGDTWIVYYTGYDHARQSGQMLYATGTGPDDLVKRGVALASSKTERNTKEATIGRTREGRWRLYYEYAQAGHSLIGVALGDGVAGPWHERPHPLSPRERSWDCWHLSPGPMWTQDPERPIMFYNGANSDARWRIGWAIFDRDYTRIIARCEDPLLRPGPHPEFGKVDIAFAASCLHVEPGLCRLYLSVEDRLLFRATVRRGAWTHSEQANGEFG